MKQAVFLVRLVRCSAVGLLLLMATSHAQTLTWPEALAAVEDRTDVINARIELDDAERALVRRSADPLALRPDLLQAQQRVNLARVRLTQARYAAIREITQAYTQVLEAQAQSNLAELAVSVNEQALDIAQIRVERGGAIELDLREAETSLQDARKNAATARDGLALARSSLASLLNDDVLQLEPLSFALLPDPPSLGQLRFALREVPTLVQVQQGRDLAALGVELLDPSYAPQADIDAAQAQLESAEESLLEVRRGLELQAQALFDGSQRTAAELMVREASLANSRQRLGFERQRLESGLIATINFRQSELATEQAEIAFVQAKHAYLLQLLELQENTMLPLPEIQALLGD